MEGAVAYRGLGLLLTDGLFAGGYTLTSVLSCRYYPCKLGGAQILTFVSCLVTEIRGRRCVCPGVGSVCIKR